MQERSLGERSRRLLYSSAHRITLGPAGPWPRLQRHHVYNFISARLASKLLLRLLPFKKVVQRVRNRKASKNLAQVKLR